MPRLLWGPLLFLCSVSKPNGSPNWILVELYLSLSLVPYQEGLDVYVSPGEEFWQTKVMGFYFCLNQKVLPCRQQFSLQFHSLVVVSSHMRLSYEMAYERENENTFI